MGKFRAGESSNAVLEAILVGSVVALASILNPLLLFQLVGQATQRNDWDRRKLQRSVQRLKKQRLLVFEEKEGLVYVKLSARGKREAQRLRFASMQLVKPKKWDSKWRLVLFDIPARPKRFNKARDAFRDTLRRLGFIPLQKSAWIQPLPCQDEIMALSTFYGLAPFVKIALVEHVNGEQALRRHFGL